MATSHLGQFDTLFNKSVPHILEKIFFALDYDSFLTCRRVCRTWKDLMSSESYHRMSAKLLEKKKENEKRLRQFSEYGNNKEVQKLLSDGVNPNCQSAEFMKETPLHKAVSRGHTDVVKLLLDAGADPNKAINFGHTPLTLAVVNGNVDIVKILLDKGADPNTRDFYGDTPLRFTTINGNTDMVKVLLDAGANPNKGNCYGQGPLYWATRYGRADVVKLLLDHGAQPNIRANNGESPLDWALKNGNKIVAKILRGAILRGKKRKLMNHLEI